MDSKRLAEIADVMEDRGLTRVRVEEPDGTAVELERASAAQPVAVPMPMPGAMAAPVAAPTVAPAAPELAAQAPAAAPEPKGTEVTAPMVGVFYAARRRATNRLCAWAPRSRPARPSASSRP